MNKVKNSMLQQSIRIQKVIPNGVDVELFKPLDKMCVRQKLGLDSDEFILLFVADSVKKNVWKDFATLKKSMEILSTQQKQIKFRLICVGDDAASEFAGDIPITFIPHTENLERLINFYQAANLYIHATKTDTFPTVILEALACGLPVIATAVDGVPEQIKPLHAPVIENIFMQQPSLFERDKATGVLVSSGGAHEIAQWVNVFSKEIALTISLAANARADALERFDFRKQVEHYLAFYKEILADFRFLKNRKVD